MTAGTFYIAAFGRLLIAVIFLFSGVGKILAPTMTLGYIASAGLPAPMPAYVIAITVEIGGGTLLVFGFQTRLVAIVMALFSVATAVGFHRDFADQDQLMHFLKNIAMVGGLFQVVAFGAGAFSIDAWLGASSAESRAATRTGLLMMRSASELLSAHLHFLTRDFKVWKSLFADNAVMEYVYGGPAGVESPLIGIDAIAKSVSGFLEAVSNFHPGAPTIRRIEGEDAVLAEFSADADVVKTGRKYHQDYAIYLRASEGRIIFYREYFDPTRVVAAFVA